MKRKNMNLNELRRLVEETISETYQKNTELNRTKSASKRKKIIESVITDTVRLVHLFEEQDRMDQVDPNTPAGGQEPQQTEQSSGVSTDRTAIQDFANFMEQIMNGTYDLTGAKNNISSFLKKKDSAGVPYYEMVLAGSGQQPDTNIQFKPKGFRVADLKPSQSQVFLPQSISGYLTRKAGKHGPSAEQTLGTSVNDEATQSIYTSEDGYIVDGHHRCSAAYGLNPNVQFGTTCINKEIKAALSLLNVLLDALVKKESGGSGKAYQASGDDAGSIWSTNPTKEAAFDVLNTICEAQGYQEPGDGGRFHAINPDFAADTAVESWIKFLKLVKSKGVSFAVEQGKGAQEATEAVGNPDEPGFKPGKDAFAGSAGQEDHEGDITSENYREVALKFCEYVCANLNSWKKPAAALPPRTDMPQLEDKGTGTDYFNAGPEPIKQGLAQGKFDHSAPFQESIDLRRWHKLAGILKD